MRTLHDPAICHISRFTYYHPPSCHIALLLVIEHTKLLLTLWLLKSTPAWNTSPRFLLTDSFLSFKLQLKFYLLWLPNLKFPIPYHVLFPCSIHVWNCHIYLFVYCLSFLHQKIYAPQQQGPYLLVSMTGIVSTWHAINTCWMTASKFKELSLMFSLQ